jgi:hypothetical protein
MTQMLGRWLEHHTQSVDNTGRAGRAPTPGKSPLQRIRRARLEAALIVALLAALFLMPAVSRADFAVVNGSHYLYERLHVPDLDQYRRMNLLTGVPGLPNDGKTYCTPTAAMNWLAYIANHGYFWISPGFGNWEPSAPDAVARYAQMTKELLDLGIEMQTDAQDGTYSGPARTALEARLQQEAPGLFTVSSATANYSYAPTLDDMALLAIDGAAVIPGIGWYHDDPKEGFPPGTQVRVGGHQISLTGAAFLGSQKYIAFSDPWYGGGGGDTQSDFKTESYAADDVTDTFGYMGSAGAYYDMRTQTRINAPYSLGHGFLDGFLAIIPKYSLSRSLKLIIINSPVSLGMDRSQTRSYRSPTGGDIRDLAIDPISTKHPYLVEGSNAVWLLDVLNGESSRLASVDAPLRLVLGGPERTVYVLTPDEIIALGRDGTELQRRRVPAPLDALAFDESRTALVALSRTAEALFIFGPDLGVQQSFALPKSVLGSDARVEISTSIDPRDGTIWVLRAGSARLARLRVSDLAGLSFDEVELSGAPEDTEAVDVDEQGVLFVSAGGLIQEFDSNGRPLRNPTFAGFAGGRDLHIVRAYSNFDPDRMSGPSWHNVVPTDPQRVLPAVQRSVPAARRNPPAAGVLTPAR